MTYGELKTRVQSLLDGDVNIERIDSAEWLFMLNNAFGFARMNTVPQDWVMQNDDEIKSFRDWLLPNHDTDEIDIDNELLDGVIFYMCWGWSNNQKNEEKFMFRAKDNINNYNWRLYNEGSKAKKTTIELEKTIDADDVLHLNYKKRKTKEVTSVVGEDGALSIMLDGNSVVKEALVVDGKLIFKY
jgi:hypothetical protein